MAEENASDGEKDKNGNISFMDTSLVISTITVEEKAHTVTDQDAFSGEVTSCLHVVNQRNASIFSMTPLRGDEMDLKFKMKCMHCGETFFCSGQASTIDGSNSAVSPCLKHTQQGVCSCPSCYLNRLREFKDLDELASEFLPFLEVCWNITSREEMMTLFVMARVKNGNIYKT